jgi:hypothetical protein
MRYMTSKTNTTPNTEKRVSAQQRLGLSEQRRAMVPTQAVVSNIDPDFRTFGKGPLQGMVMVQEPTSSGVTGRLLAWGDFDQQTFSYKIKSQDNPEGIQQGVSGQQKLKYPVLPDPGQPTLIYPVSAGSPSVGASFIRGGKATPQRKYPAQMLWRGASDHSGGT